MSGVLLVVLSSSGKATVQRSDALQRGVLSLPHGYGMNHPQVAGGPRVTTGPAINELTSADHCDPRTKTPFHKGVPVRLEILGNAHNLATEL